MERTEKINELKKELKVNELKKALDLIEETMEILSKYSDEYYNDIMMVAGDLSGAWDTVHDIAYEISRK